MPIKQLNHINIRAPREILDRCRDFYVDILGLEQGFRPSFSSQGYWLYAEDAPIVHLVVSGDNRAADSNLDHAAFDCEDYETIAKRLADAGFESRQVKMPNASYPRLFLNDPAGVKIELNFPDD